MIRRHTMNVLRTTICTGLLILAPSLQAETWTLAGAIAVAQADNPDARIAQERLAGAEALIEQARAAWLPQLSLQARYTETNSPMMAFGAILNQRAFSFGLDFNHPGRIDNLNATGTVAYNLYSGGRATAGLAATRAGRAAAEQDVQATRQQLAGAATKAYFNLRKAREAVISVEGGVRAFEAAVSAAQARFDAGQLLKADLLSLQVQLAQMREAHSSARHQSALAGKVLLLVLGRDTAAVVELAETDPSVAQLVLPDETAHSLRPELRGLQHRLEAAESMVAAARGARRPTVNAFASYQYDRGWQTRRDGDSWMAGVSADLNVFDGGQTSGRIRQSLAQVAELKELLRKTELGIGFEVAQARLAHADAAARLAVTDLAVAQAEESAALSRFRFAKGALLTAELIGTESRLVEARMRRTVAQADVHLAIADLRRALGRPILE